MDYDPSELEFIQCSRCGYTSDDLEEFVYEKHRANGRKNRCRICDNNYVKIRGIEGYNLIVEICGDKCERCGTTYPPQVFDLHHLDPRKKEYGLSQMKGMNRDKIREERAKGIVVCANCHRIIHMEIRHAQQGSSG